VELTRIRAGRVVVKIKAVTERMAAGVATRDRLRSYPPSRSMVVFFFRGNGIVLRRVITIPLSTVPKFTRHRAYPKLRSLLSHPKPS
jgi:hypothetical protein